MNFLNEFIMKKKLTDYRWIARFLATPFFYVLFLIDLYMLIPVLIQSWINKVKNRIIIDIPKSSKSIRLPSNKEFEDALIQKAYKVPFDGTYDKQILKNWRECWEWVKSYVENDNK